MRKLGNLVKKLILIAIGIYAITTFFNQQNILNTYATNSEELTNQIAEAKDQNEKLKEKKQNVNSEQYIEEMAREKLDMYLPNERVYINNEQ